MSQISTQGGTVWGRAAQDTCPSAMMVVGNRTAENDSRAGAALDLPGEVVDGNAHKPCPRRSGIGGSDRAAQ